ncbi:hypothetical protein TWF506_000352 [Arthrobotrys conoides]|uniref:Uncharacterized protein n=1 Tax=Arthrobotrys conoides TaxID=74498 RepID=A0AAN8PQN5_9PEZI
MPVIDPVSLVILGGPAVSLLILSIKEVLNDAATTAATAAASVAVAEVSPILATAGTGVMLIGTAGCGLAVAAIGAVGVQIYDRLKASGGNEGEDGPEE